MSGPATTTDRTATPTARVGRGSTAPVGRVRVDGKYFARGGRRYWLRGVTYGPFAPDAAGESFPSPGQVAADFARMRAAGVNAVRTYHVPPRWFLAEADAAGMGVVVDVPWAKHLCFLDDRARRAEARRAIRQGARTGRRHDCVVAYSVGNEIPPDVLRWHGARPVARFLAELCDEVRQADPDALVTYANYPPTEYLDLACFDFVTFNVYLHDPETFRRYLFRLQNLVGDRPLVLGELGMDTLRHGEDGQARFLGSHLRDAALLGLAGTFVFSWTDDWYTGGAPVHSWNFGVTRADRTAKASYHTLRGLFGHSPTRLLGRSPRVSVVVCTYNGARTLAQCLRSLRHLDYPEYEVVVVDDGSTDETAAILHDFPEVRVVRQPNLGLSAARNAGLRAASGSVIAYTDSDCYADPHWLTHLVHRLVESDAAAVGGPNLTPDDGRLTACVAACPGQPVHVLESDQVAEHIPGCNMAFRREALEAVNGFDEQFRTAGDDVDLCWRLQQAGLWITFAPGAFVWHHRRQNPRAYLRQQAGYGEAEALLGFKHPGKFNRRGSGKWRGVLYGASLQGVRLGGPIIYRGTYATGPFQCLYQPAPAHWAMLPATLEWQAAAVVAALAGLAWLPAAAAAAVMIALSVAVAALQATQARLPAQYDRWSSRLLVLTLSYAQPLVRSWARYRTRLFRYRSATTGAALPFAARERLPATGRAALAYWSDGAGDRIDFLRRAGECLAQYRWGQAYDTGWSDWDLEVYCHPHPWTVVRVATAQEEHGQGQRLVRVRLRLRPTPYTRAILTAALFCAAAALSFAPAAAAAAGLLTLAVGVWWRGTAQAAQVAGVFDAVAAGLGWLPVEPRGRGREGTISPDPARADA